MRKLALFAAGYSTAVFAATAFLPGGVHLPLGGFCVLLSVVLRLWGKSIGKRRRCAILCCAGAAAGLLWTWGYNRLFVQPVRELDDKTVVLIGVVMDWPEETDYGGSVMVRAQLAGRGRVNTLLYIDERDLALQPGDQITTVAHCRLATHTKDGEQISYYFSKGIFMIATAYGGMELHRPERVPLSCIPVWISRGLKERIAHCFPDDVFALAQALVTGDREELTDAYTSALQRTGLTHVVAVSGMHLAYLVGLFTLVLGRGRRRTALLSLPFIGLFVLVAGCTPSVVRAAVMIVLLQLAPLLDRERDDFTALAFALLLLLIQNPYAAASAGLQLSFGAVAGIFLFCEGLQERMLNRVTRKKPGKSLLYRLWNRLAYFVVSILAATLGTAVFTVPLTAFYFDTIALISPLANLLALWAVSVGFSGSVIAGVLGAFWPAVGEFAAVLVTPFLRYLNALVPLLARIPLAAIPATNPPYQAWLFYLYGLLVLALVMPVKKRVLVPILGAAVTLAVAVLVTNITFYAGSMQVQVLDVGQGQSVLIRSGKHLALVDCGGDSYDNPGDVAADQIQALGRSQLDLLVISHYHTDHANGIPQLLERISVSEIILPDVEPESALRTHILEQAQRYGISVRFVRDEFCFEFGDGAQFTVYPPLGEGTSNELGLTVLFSSGDYDALLTGDMGTVVERVLVEQITLPDVELLVAGHHGSKNATSQLLLDQVKPEVVVFSVGANNDYGHPAQETLDRCASVGAQLYRTDLMGTVTVAVEPNLN